MFGYAVGSKIGSELMKKKKFKPIIIIAIIFMIIGLIMIISALRYINLKHRLQNEGVIVNATIYPYTRISLSNDEYSGLYYEWEYDGKYYSSKIPSYDGFAEKAGEGAVYEIYIDKENPNKYVRVNDESNPLAGGLLVFNVGLIPLIFVLIYRNKVISDSKNENTCGYSNNSSINNVSLDNKNEGIK